MCAIIFGTRPEIIKFATIIHEIQHRNNLDFLIIHTGQHYDYKMSEIFIEELGLPKPDFNLEIGSGSHSYQTAIAMLNIEKILLKEAPDIVLVQGDTNSTLAGALAAAKLNIPLGHVEAGCRSFDSTMPEEINRILVDHCSDFLFASTESKKLNLLKEGLAEDKIFVSGDTLIDFLFKVDKIIEEDIKKDIYGVLTIHRVKSTEKETLTEIFEGINSTELKIFFPIHPRTQKKINEMFIQIPKNVVVLQPLSYFEFLKLLKNSSMVITDSGGVQEEACFYEIPCITLRKTTEWIETVDAGLNYLVGLNSTKIKEQILSLKNNFNREKLYKKEFYPLGKEGAGRRIVDHLFANLKR